MISSARQQMNKKVDGCISMRSGRKQDSFALELIG